MEESLQKINPFAVGGAFVELCVEKGLIVIEMDDHQLNYYITPQGEKALHTEFGIVLKSCAKLDK
ncbi:MAG: hypothetical protein ACRCST_00955 [Turicibacter sp.]